MLNGLTEQDFIPFNDFELKWRFTEKRHNIIVQEDLSLLRPLSKTKTAKFNKYSQQYLGNASLLSSAFNQIDTLKIRNSQETVNTWLSEKNINPETNIIISWDNSSGLVTQWQIFCKYWDDFCYPSSDDILIWTATENWVLYYCHEEIFQFGIKK